MTRAGRYCKIHIMNKDKRRKLINKKKFKNWLESKSPKTKVANKHYDSTSCPVARYIKQTNDNISEVYVSADVSEPTVEIEYKNNKKVTFIQPKWLNKFVKEVDNFAGYYTGAMKSVSAKQALNILNKIVDD